MIKSFRLRNFKAFEDTGDIELKPLTVIAGPNSSGKSSILQSLLLLKQTLDAPPEARLSLDGRFFQYSDFSDLVFGKPPLSDCNVGFSFELETPMLREEVARNFPGLELPYTSEEHVEFNARMELSFRHRGRRRQGAVILDSFEVLSEMHGVEGPRLTGTLQESNSLSYSVSMAGEGIELPEPFADREIVSVFLRQFTPVYLELKEDKKARVHPTFLRVPTIFAQIYDDFEDEIDLNLQYLGPLRERPRRAYLHSGDRFEEIGESGQHAAQILWLEKGKKIQYLPALGKETQSLTLMEAVNSAFQQLGLFQPISVRSEKSMVYQILFELSEANSRKKAVTIADVGFGVSQLLPILVLGLRADETSLLMFEQPEIHLHPKLQANLGGFLLDPG